MIPKTGGNRFSRLALRHRRQLVVPGHQQHRRAARARPAHAQQPELPVRRQPGARRPDHDGQAVVLHLGPVHAAEQLRRRRCSRTRTRSTSPSGTTSRTRTTAAVNDAQGGQREPAPDLAGQPDQQVQLLLRPPLALPVCGHQRPRSRRRPPTESTTRSRTWSPCPIRPRCPAACWSRPALAPGASEFAYTPNNLEDPLRLLIPVIEQAGLIPGLLYRGGGVSTTRPSPTSARWASSCPGRRRCPTSPGSHSAKFGVYNVTASRTSTVPDNFAKLTYRFNNGVPNQLTQRATPLDRTERQRFDLGLYAQDKWTLNRLTLSGGIRFDMFQSYFPEQTLGPGPWCPPATSRSRRPTWPTGRTWCRAWARPTTCSATARTAVKVSLNKYVTAQGLQGTYGDTANPVNRLANIVTRTWTDADRDYVADCDLTNVLAQDLRATGGDFCGVVSDTNFGKPTLSLAYDPETLQRLGHATLPVGVLDQRAAPDRVARVGGRGLLPPLVWQLRRDRQPDAEPIGFRHLRHRHSGRPAAAGRRQLGVAVSRTSTRTRRHCRRTTTSRWRGITASRSITGTAWT